MQPALIAGVILLANVLTFAQDIDTGNVYNKFKSGGSINQKFLKDNGTSGIHVFRNLTVKSNSTTLIGKELEISQMEEKECNAVLKGNTTLLRSIWARDFTLDEPQNKVNASKNGLTTYLRFSRMIEQINDIGDTVFTSGYEEFLPITEETKLTSVKRTFFHTWKKSGLQWRLVTNTQR